MSERHSRRPYAWAALGVAAIVAAAWFNQGKIVATIPGNPAPSFEMLNSDGEVVSLDDYAGKVVLVNVWGTWCEPCRAEMPSMERLYQQFDRDDFEILAVSIDVPVGQMESIGIMGRDPQLFADTLGLTFPILLNPEGDIQRTFQTTGVPESFLIARDGVIYKRVAGATAWDEEANLAAVRRLVDSK